MTSWSDRTAFHGWRVVFIVIVWNILFLIDRQLLGYRVVGPLAVVALAGVAVISFTAPVGKYPGQWIMKKPTPPHRWRWLFWYVGLITSTLAVFALLEILGYLKEISDYLQSHDLG